MLAGLIFLCVVASAGDGDSMTCRDGTRIRLAAIDAPETGECRPRGRRCVPGDAITARDALRRLALGKTIRCERSGNSYDRIVAWCSAPGSGSGAGSGTDLSCAQVRAGHAVRIARFDPAGRLRECVR